MSNIKFKIEPGMAIKCENTEEVKQLWMWFWENGYVNSEYIDSLDNMLACIDSHFSIGEDGRWATPADDELEEMKCVEFSDMVEPEIETVSICRIIEVLPDDRKRCVHEEDIKTDQTPCGSERIAVEEILKRYCMEHDGEFRAVHEVISRVKKS